METRQIEQERISPKQALINALKDTLDMIAANEKKYKTSKEDFLNSIKFILISHGKLNDIQNDLDEADQLCFHNLELKTLANEINKILLANKETMLGRELEYHLEVNSSRYLTGSYDINITNMITITEAQLNDDVVQEYDTWTISNFRKNKIKFNNYETDCSNQAAHPEDALPLSPNNQSKRKITPNLAKEIKLLRTTYQTNEAITEFCKHLDLLKDATIKEGATDDMLLDDIERISYALADFNIKTASKLYQRINMHKQASNNRIKGGAATVASGGALGASATYGLGLFSMSMPVCAAAGIFLLAIGTAAGTYGATDAKNKRGTLADLEANILSQKMHALLVTKKYADYLQIAIKFIMMDASNRSTNLKRDSQLLLCSDIIHRENKCNTLFLMLDRLTETHHRLKKDSSTSIAADDIYQLIKTISSQLLVDMQPNEYMLIQVKLIKIDAQKRSSNPERDQELDQLITTMKSSMETADNFCDLLTNTADTLSKLAWNKSDTAEALHKLVKNVESPKLTSSHSLSIQ